MSPMRRHIAVIGYFGLGDVMPTLDTVAELVARGHRVSYLTSGGALRWVAAAGATAIEYDSVVAGVDLTVMDTPGRMDELMPLGVEEDRALVAAALRHLGHDRPDLIISDVLRFTAGRVLGRKWGVPTGAFCPVLVSNELFSFDDRVRDLQTASPRKRRSYRARTLRNVATLLAEHGHGDVSSIEEFYRPHEGLFVAFYPRSFQVAGESCDERHVFVGPSLSHGLELGDWRPPADGRPVLLVSLGTSVYRRPDFFRVCVEAFRDTEWQVVLHVHDDLPAAALGELPRNVEVHRWLPQLAVLEHTDVLLCHGGMGTLMAAFARQTSVVVVPNSAEQMINTDRVVELGLGRALAKDAVEPDALRRAVLALHADEAVRARVAAMSEDIRRAGGGVRAADAIEAYLRRSVG